MYDIAKGYFPLNCTLQTFNFIRRAMNAQSGPSAFVAHPLPAHHRVHVTQRLAIPRSPLCRFRLFSHSRPSLPANNDARRKWLVAGAASVVHALHVAAVYIGPSTLLSPMREELGLSIIQIALPLNVFRIINSVFLLPVGYLLDRVGATRVMWPAIAATGVIAIGMPFAQNLVHLTLLQALFAVAKLFGGLTTMLMLVNAAFRGGPVGRDSHTIDHAGVGAGAGMVLAGWSLAGCFGPALVGMLSVRFGWRFAFAVLSALFVCIAMPLSYVFLRGDGAHTGSIKPEHESVHEPVFSRPYMCTLLMVGAMSVSYHVILDHLPIFMREDMGINFTRASLYISLTNFCGIVGKLAGGFLSDRFRRGPMLALFSVLTALSCMLLFQVAPGGALLVTASQTTLLAFAVAYGLSYSVVFTLITAALPLFGYQRLGLRSNLNLTLLFAFGSIGSYIGGHLRMMSGSYALSFLLSMSMWAIILMLAAVYTFYDKAPL